MLIAGIDIGSGTTKCVLVDGRGRVRGRAQVKTKADFEITDLTCGARGAATLFPDALHVLDIGAQCSRAIKLRDRGKVKEFHMNEKCAAGSGGFLERAAKYLEVSVGDIGPLSLGAAKPQAISSVCAVLEM